MNTFRLALRSVCYYWRTTVALTLGVVVATAVIGGAIVVGDSVRDSLADMTLQRLGKVQLALHSPRFIREQVAADLTAAARNRSLGNRLRTAPAILLDGSLEAGEATSIRRVTNANVVGLTDRMWNMLNHGSAQVPGERQVVLGARVARELNAGVGDQLRLWVEIPESVPRETLLGERDEISQEISVTVSDAQRDRWSQPLRPAADPAAACDRVCRSALPPGTAGP